MFDLFTTLIRTETMKSIIDSPMLQSQMKFSLRKMERFKDLLSHNSDPLEPANPSKEHKSTSTDLFFQRTNERFVLKAVETFTSTIVVFLIGMTIDASFTDEIKKIADAEINQCRVVIFNFVALASEKANIFERFGIDQCIRLYSICVHKDLKVSSIELTRIKTLKRGG